MSDYSSEDDLPDLAAILAPKPLMPTSTNTWVRRSPRKQNAVVLVSDMHRSPEKKRQRNVGRSQESVHVQLQPKPKPSSRQNTRHRQQRSPTKSVEAKKPPSFSIPDIPIPIPIPLQPRSLAVSGTILTSTSTSTSTSNNRRSPTSCQRNLKPARIDSLLLPLESLALEGERSDAGTGSGRSMMGAGIRGTKKATVSVIKKTKTERPAKDKSEARNTNNTNNTLSHRGYASRFFLSEARCNDDGESDSMDERDGEEDEDTDLSGFIVDDNAELSYHDSSSSGSDDDADISRRRRSPAKTAPAPAPRRRLQRGSPTRRRLDFSCGKSDSDSGSGSGSGLDKENGSADTLSNALRNMCLDHGRQSESQQGESEVIDLTSSPVRAPPLKPESDQLQQTDPPHRSPRNNQIPFDDLDAVLKLEPPVSRPALLIPPQDMPAQCMVHGDGDDARGRSVDPVKDEDEDKGEFKTPTTTPPQSPSKLKSPSKLLSPSKRQTIPQSPHRQSMDAFWDHNAVNEWNDAYSPKKAPATSPRKRPFAPFTIFSDSDSDSENDHDGDRATCESSDSLPSPCSSPRKTKPRPRSPTKSPEKEEKKRLLEEKRAAAARKKEFDSRKGQLATDLLHELDTNVAGAKLGELSSSTGGVKIIWSKTLRSTAGRANWKRTVTKLSGSPVKRGEEDTAGPGTRVQHFASIELAEKIIDCDDRLVNTLAHEFCHLANFMISNVRDQPHGASFKKWAAKVTAHLRQSPVDIWRQVQVTTKHSYIINHKYLWVCVGRDRTPAMDFLNLSQEEQGKGCGAEYGRHSKSIDTERHRCGKCKGRLVQIRPKPRATTSPRKKSRVGSSRERSADSSGSGSGFGSRSGSGSGFGSGSQSSSDGRTGSVLGSMIETVELSD